MILQTSEIGCGSRNRRWSRFGLCVDTDAQWTPNSQFTRTDRQTQRENNDTLTPLNNACFGEIKWDVGSWPSENLEY